MPNNLEQHTILTEMIDALTIGVVLINTKSHVIEYINNAGARITNVRRKEVVGRECKGFVCGAWDGECPVLKSGKQIQEEEHILLTPGGDHIPILRSTKIITIGDEEYLVEIFHDLSALENSLEGLAVRDRMLEGLAGAINTLVTGLDRLDEAIEDTLALLGLSADVDGVFLFRFSSSPKLIASPTLRYSWRNNRKSGNEQYGNGQSGDERTADSDDEEKSLVSKEQWPPHGRIKEFLLTLKQGDVVTIKANDLTDEERSSLGEFAYPLCICAPIYTKVGLWGFLNYSVRSEDYEWSNAVRSILISAAESFGGALSVKKTEEQLEAEVEKAEKLALQAEKANRSKSSFLAHMSHEIRTPLNGVLGFLNLLSETALTDDQKEYLADAKTSADSLLALINDILDFSKIEAGKVEIEKSPFNPLSLIEETAVTLLPLSKERNNELTVCIKGDVPEEIIGDPGRYRQILINLGGNAAKFTENGRISIELTMERETAREAYLTTHVIDTGIGIDESILDSLFDPFRQAKSSTNRKYGGTGLGLSISKHLTHLMGGRLECESKLGEGSHFRFTIPFKKKKSTADGGHSGKPLFTGTEFVVCSDNPDLQRMLMTYIEEWDGRSVSSATGSPLTEGEERGDIFLIDCSYRETDCLDRVKSIVEDLERETTSAKVFFLIDPEKQKVVQPFVSSDRCFFIAKPVRKTVLYRKVAEALGVGHDQTAGEVETSEQTDQRGARDRDIRILIAEDNAINQKLTAKLLQKRGFVCEIASDGKEAVEMYKTGRFDLVLMDCQMPEVDGYMATIRIRKLERSDDASSKKIPIIALTAHALKGEQQKVKAAGMDDYLSKPINPQKLASRIEHWLRKRNVF